MIISVLLVSKSPVGSSNSKIEGLLAIDLAIVTLYCSPPESMLGKWSILVPNPTSLSKPTALFLIYSLVNLPLSYIGSSTFSNAVSDPIRLNV